MGHEAVMSAGVGRISVSILVMSRIVKESLKKTVKGATLVFASTVGSLAIWFVDRVILIRFTSAEDLGIYSLVVAVSIIVGLLSCMGLNEGSTRYISIFLGEGREDDARAVGRASMLIGVLSSAVASLAMFLLADWMAGSVFYKPELKEPLQVFSIIPFFYAVPSILVGIARGYGDIRPKVYHISIAQPAILLILFSAYAYFSLPFIYVLWFYVISQVLSGIAVFLHCRIGVMGRAVALRGGRYFGKLLKFSIPILGVAAMNMIFSWTDTLMLGRYTNAEDVGVYNVAVSLVRLLSFPIAAYGFVFLPIAGELYARDQKAEMKRTYQVITKWIFFITLPMFFVLFFFPEMVISFVFNARYVPASSSLAALSIGYLVNVFVGANIMIMMVMGMSRSIMVISLLGTIGNVLLNYIFIKHMGYGILGASWATTMSFALIGGLNSLILWRRSGIHALTANYLKPIAASVVVGLLLYVMSQSLPLHLWMLPFYLALFVLGYALSILLTRSLEREDLDLMDSIARRAGFDATGVIQWFGRFVR